MTSQALLQAERIGTLEEPLEGHHRRWYVVRTEGEFAHLGRVKIAEPRENALWSDRRCFVSEEQLLEELAGLGFTRIPPVHRTGDDCPPLVGFTPGVRLSDLSPAGEPVGDRELDAVMRVFDRLARVGYDGVASERSCEPEQHADDWDSPHFLRTLIRFTYDNRSRDYDWLFGELGVTARADLHRKQLDTLAGELERRPFCLLHGDLHRANFIVDPQGELWTIDWELAMIGDPVYDLATHLHLMQYPVTQQETVIRRWCEVMAVRRPAAVREAPADVERYLAYKRVQSVHNDVVRQAVAVRDAEPDDRQQQIAQSAKIVEGVLERANRTLDPRDGAPALVDIEAAYEQVPER